LVVGVDSDARVKELKGENRPIIPCAHRMEMVNALRPVGLVFEVNRLDDFAVVTGALNVKRVFKNDAFIGRESEIAGIGGETKLVIVPDLNLPDSTSTIIEDVLKRRAAQSSGQPQEALQQSVAPVAKKLGQILLAKGIVTPVELQQALRAQTIPYPNHKNHRRLGDILVQNGVCTQEDVCKCVAVQLGVPFVAGNQLKVESEALNAVPANIAKMNNIMPIRKDGGTLTVAMATVDSLILDNLCFVLDLDIKPVMAMPDDIRELQDKFYS